MTARDTEPYIPTVLIVGGGISGLTTGLCLSHLIPGCKPLILERHAHLTDLGGPITLSPNGTRVFKSIGLLESLAAISDDGSVRVLMRGDSGEVLRENTIDTHDGSPYLIVMRGELLRWLHDRFCERGGTVRFGSEVTNLDEREDGVRVTTAQVDVFTVDLVIAADGVRSSLRPGIIPDFRAQVSYSSTCSITGCDIPSSLMLRDPESVLAKLYLRAGPTIWMGPGRYLVTAPMPRLNVFWLVFADHGKEVAAHEDWAVAGDLDRVRQRFSAFVGGGAAELMDAAAAAAAAARDLDSSERQCVNWTAACVGPFTSWRSPLGRVILHGDAAHAMLPDAGQGATQCLESALSLALFCQAARSAADIPVVTLRHERFRKPRAEKVQRLGQDNSTAFRLQDLPKGDEDETASGVQSWDEQQEWLYRYDVALEVQKYLEELSRLN